MISKIKTRKLAVTILVLILISSFAPFGMMLAKGAATTKFPLEVFVDNNDGTTDTLRLADHTDNADGNWIELVGTDGDTVTLPDPITVDVTSSINEKSFTYQGKTVTIDTEFSWPKQVTYPFTSHKVYHSGDSVEIEFTSNSDYDGDTVELRLIAGTLNGVRNLVTEALNGNISPLKDYISDNEVSLVGQTEYTLSVGNYDFTHDFGALTPGDYVAVVLDETEGTDYALNLYSLTPIEVLDYELTVTPSYNDIQETLEVGVVVESAAASTYSYASVLISQDIYSLYVDVDIDGTLAGSTVEVSHDDTNYYTVIENNQFLGVSLNDYSDLLSKSFWENVLSDLKTQSIISAGDIEFGMELQTTATSLTGPVDSLKISGSDSEGSYWLMTIVYEHGSKRIAGFDQQAITLGQAINIDSITTSFPGDYGDLVPIEITISSSEAYTGAKLNINFKLDGIDVQKPNEIFVFDISSGTQAYAYSFDSLYRLAKTSSAGGTITVSYTITDSADNELAPGGSFSGSLNGVRKSSLAPRVNQIVGEWVNADAARKNYLSDMVNKIVGLWVNAP